MKILIDINHPAHVHYFRNFANLISGFGHETFFVARDKEMAQRLLGIYKIDFIDRGEGREGFIGKFIYLLQANLKIYQIAKKHKIDLFINFLHPYPSQVAKWLGKPSVVFSDSEHAKMHHQLTVPFATTICTPSCYTIDLGAKHQRFKGFMELSYLHPRYYQANPDIFQILGLYQDERYIIIRFVSWKAVHDVGHSGLSLENKKAAIQELGKHAKIFISAEGELPAELENYRLTIPIERIHDVLFYSDMIFGESATMSAEAAILGTPAFYISSLRLGYLNQMQEEFGLVFNYDNQAQSQKAAIKNAVSILKDPESKSRFKAKRNKLLENCVDTTDFMVQQANLHLK